MSFSPKQVHALRRNLDGRKIRIREAHGRELSYIEGWFAISEANRIFGFDGWSRETVETRCVLARENRGTFTAVYIAKVRITVQADGCTIVREGHGSGEGRGTSPGDVHDIALKAAETDATKRAFATFGKPFGLELYRQRRTRAQETNLKSPIIPPTRLGFHPDDTTPSRGPRAITATARIQKSRRGGPPAKPAEGAPPLAPEILPAGGKIDKSALALPEPKRRRDKSHLRFVASQPCIVCGATPAIRITYALPSRAHWTSR